MSEAKTEHELHMGYVRQTFSQTRSTKTVEWMGDSVLTSTRLPDSRYNKPMDVYQQRERSCMIYAVLCYQLQELSHSWSSAVVCSKTVRLKTERQKKGGNALFQRKNGIYISYLVGKLSRSGGHGRGNIHETEYVYLLPLYVNAERHTESRRFKGQTSENETSCGVMLMTP